MQNINIKAVTQITGINENTLRAWERRYQIVEPARSEDGHRLYSKKDIEKITLLWRLVQQGHLIGNLASMSLRELQKMAGELEAARASASLETPNAGPAPEDEHLQTIVDALKKFDLDSIQKSLQSARFELSPKAIVTNLILPLLRNVGVLVMKSELSISQEHLLSSLLRDYLGNLFQSLSPYDYKNRMTSSRVLLTTREGDLHEFGILLAAILCRVHGHETYYLGPNMPVDDLAQACEQFKIKTLILGLAELPKERELITAQAFLKEFDRLAPKQVTVVCGGSTSGLGHVMQAGRPFIIFSSIQDLDSYLAKNK